MTAPGLSPALADASQVAVRVHFTERGELLSFCSAKGLRLTFQLNGYADDEYTASHATPRRRPLRP